MAPKMAPRRWGVAVLLALAGEGLAQSGDFQMPGGLEGLLGAALGGKPGGGPGGGGFGRPGAPLCPAGKVPVPGPDNHKAFSANGCGPQGMQIKEPYGLHRCCNFHDVCFSTCGTTHDWCEKQFKQCMKRTCKNPLNGADSGQCHQQAESFSGLTNLFGGGFHESSQRMSCKCVDEDRAEEEHRSYLTSFLKEYDPDDAHDESVQEKLSKWKGKEGKMYALLVKKHGTKFVKFHDVAAEFEEAPPPKPKATEL